LKFIHLPFAQIVVITTGKKTGYFYECIYWLPYISIHDVQSSCCIKRTQICSTSF